jgi:tetratricopeptide (TPR) repeat protein
VGENPARTDQRSERTGACSVMTMRRAPLTMLVIIAFSAMAAIFSVVKAEPPSLIGQFLPKRPADSRPAEAKRLIDGKRYSEAIAMLEEYLEDVPRDNDSRVQLGWCQYRLGQFARAKDTFAEALERDANSDDARVGLGYSELQLRGADAAAGWFREVLQRDANHRDALEALVVAGQRAGASREVVAEARRAGGRLAGLSGAVPNGRIAPGVEKRMRAAEDPSRPLVVRARAVRHYLEINENGTWTPIFIRGFNLGAALPGRYPSQFPTDAATYRQWLESIAGMNANAVRVYTLLPPEFYSALHDHNARNPGRRLWLIQGVWAELPPKHDFSDPDYLREFHAETARIIDAVHGNLVLGPRAGHASGAYTADASSSVLAYIIGREWEPFAVADYNAMHAGAARFDGRWYTVTGGAPMESWVASVCDYAAEYEASHYRVMRPLTFANWPTLDPLHHPTESTAAEEDHWRKVYKLPARAARTVVWEDDAVTLDATLIHATPENETGFFAAYHIYPNFPDFLNLEPRYERGRDRDGTNRYAAYLHDLKDYHGDQPVVVAEFGMSTSRGIAHSHPNGWHHGGMTEEEQGVLVSRMLRNIHESHYAGAIVFEFMDEWFKSTWSVAPFESPADRRRMWFNAESPEQSYGVIAARPAARSIRIDGRRDDWSDSKILAAK